MTESKHFHPPTDSLYQPKMIRIQWCVDDKPYQEHWLNAESEADLNWLTHLLQDTKGHINPTVSLRVTDYIATSHSIVQPEKPLPLRESVGE